MTPNGKPTLAETMQALEVAVSSSPVAELPGLLGLLEKVKAMGWGRMLAEKQHGDEERLLTASDVAERLQLSEYRVRELIHQGRIKRVPLDGKAVRVKPSDLAAYISSNGD